MSSEEHFQKNECIYKISKEVQGQLVRERFSFKSCTNLECTSLLTYHKLNAGLTSSGCDSNQGREIQGRIDMEIFHILNSDGKDRGYHYGNFKVIDNSRNIIEGKILGLTNMGTHHERISNCERCDQLDHMEGTLDGNILNDARSLNDCRFVGSYAMKFTSTREFVSSRIDGIIEGVAVCKCGNSG